MRIGQDGPLPFLSAGEADEGQGSQVAIDLRSFFVEAGSREPEALATEGARNSLDQPVTGSASTIFVFCSVGT